MKRLSGMRIGLGIVVAVAFGVLQGSAAAATPSYTNDWWTVDGGGASAATAGDYALGATAGQPDAGTLSSGHYVLDGGFWRGGASIGAPRPRAYLPVIVKTWH
jgi:hypothetical protein